MFIFQKEDGIAITMADLNNATLPTDYEVGVGAGERDLRLTADSDAINTAAPIENLNLPFVFDGQPDRGAYEFGEPYPSFGADFDNITSLSEPDKKAYALFPNPTNHQLFLVWQHGEQPIGSIEWSFINLNGAFKKSFVTNDPVVDLSILPPGFYVVKIKTQRELIIESILIQ